MKVKKCMHNVTFMKRPTRKIAPQNIGHLKLPSKIPTEHYNNQPINNSNLVGIVIPRFSQTQLQ